MQKLFFGIAIISLFLCGSCGLFEGEVEPEEPDCKVSVANSAILVTSNVSGEEGTQISPDEISTPSISTNSAEITFRFHRVGNCHEVVNYGHVWSSVNGTPTVNNSNRSSFGSDVNFGDAVNSFMNGLAPNTKYFVRGYIQIRSKEDGSEIALYNDEVTSFITLKECNNGELQVLDDSDRQTVVESHNGNSILSFEIIRKEIANCENGQWVEADKTDKWVEIKNTFSSAISCDYTIDYKQLDDDGTIAVEWIYQNQVSRLAPGEILEQFMHRNFGNIQHGQIQITLSNLTFH